MPDIETGKAIFNTRCDRCHGLPEPSEYTTERWETILSSMIPRARLNKEQEMHLKAFVKESSGKPPH